MVETDEFQVEVPAVRSDDGLISTVEVDVDALPVVVELLLVTIDDDELSGSSAALAIKPLPETASLATAVSPDPPATAGVVALVAELAAAAWKVDSLDPPAVLGAGVEALATPASALAEPEAVGGVEGASLRAGLVAGAVAAAAPPPPP